MVEETFLMRYGTDTERAACKAYIDRQDNRGYKVGYMGNGQRVWGRMPCAGWVGRK